MMFFKILLGIALALPFIYLGLKLLGSIIDDALEDRRKSEDKK
ncbi:MAG: hypothetical protein ACTTJ2_05290 [Anaerovoracaceae bacterium]